MINIPIKPLSVNKAWQGRRFKTPEYKQYEKDVLTMLPKVRIPEGNLEIDLDVYFSNKASDVDNVAKPFIDILQKKYRFNDSRVYTLILTKFICKKGDERIEFEIAKDISDL